MQFYKLFLTLFLFSSIINANDKFDENQIVIMLNEYFISEKGPTLLGHRFYETKKNEIIQLEIEQNEHNPNTSLLFSFKAMSLITNVSQKEFNLGILVMHSENRITPIIAETDIKCAQSFFLEKQIGEKKWRKNCLTIKHN
tara:strand:- start:1829 stop:2251 length:423 start_codon:yes stop_codon:yes gene_type:complete